MNVPISTEQLTAKDFASDQEVRWCPGCGDYAILKAVQRTLPDLGVPKEKFVFVSGIGCAARFPYYMSTYGFHTIHGRAPAFATGIKLANPELDVWVISGDGDALSIGGNHLLHLLRRNVDVQFLLFNNEIYGLTKGQYSPTSRVGTRSPSTPGGSVDMPVAPARFALGAGARFVARGVDTDQKRLPDLFKRAHAHKGTSFVEILQNCIVYNDGVFGAITDREVATNAQIHLRHGEPLIFGEKADRGLRFNTRTFALEMVTLGEDGITEADLQVHDETNATLAGLLAVMEAPFPVAMGVIYCNPAATYDGAVQESLKPGPAADPLSINKLLRRGHTWQV
ncbi:2-oxoacid:ferredoxin oxidoreductase subunit beta [Oceanibacterium hippocampi]|uniref:2-oxoglutarate oxidoreductase subunit KorB n=1 Tax=Oceanibacterium hippocampi TaxID=745714 RepID=A0A1Y5S7Z3_9PROT|nr:2-oxoacid:ferredoxin oxidoreductase subunit beta [Oceanibacterium hippocampi]SLN32185.1 2-oxoglutarate oxidoreductase subunit KorB [Oceanibacterium hippocampi]